MKGNTLIWLDLETTGLEPDRETILEIGLVATRLPTFEILGAWNEVIAAPLSRLDRMHPKVVEMHKTSGLWAEVLKSEATLDDAEAGALQFFRKYNGQTIDWQSPLAGANPGFDRGFLKKHMPKLNTAFHYRNFDVRTVTLLQEWLTEYRSSAGCGPNAAHRSIQDCRDAIAAMRSFLGVA